MNKLRNYWADDYVTRQKRVLATQLKKGNIKVVAKAISDRLDTVRGSVKTTDTSISWTQEHLVEEEFTLNLGEYLVMNIGFEILSPAEFRAKFEEHHYMPSYYTASENEVKILTVLTSDEYYYGYDYICDKTELSRPDAKEAIDKLRFLGVVGFARGLMSDEGEVGGSGFGICSETRREALLYRYYLNKGEAPE